MHIGTWKNKIFNISCAAIGFVLSPLSWWNDLFVNVPLAYYFAVATGKVLKLAINVRKFEFVILFIIGYWLTNLVGMAMLKHGALKLTAREKKYSLPIKWDIVIGVSYNVIIAWVVYTDYGNILASLGVIPEWIDK